jgi:type II secretory pathway pseudopilin PulG
MKKNKTLLVVVSIVGVLGLAVFLSAYHAASTISQYNWASANANHLSICLEDFRKDYGRYPNSLPEALSKLDGGFQSSLSNILNENLHGNYEYHSQTNSFQITIRGYEFECEAFTNKIIVSGKYSTNESSF